MKIEAVSNDDIKKSRKKGRVMNRKKKARSWHKWTALTLSFFLLLFALSGILLNHRNAISSVDIDRRWLPSDYSYKNWNLASVKSSLEISDSTVLIYGNIGIWLTDKSFSSFRNFSMGMPDGIDNKKVFAMLKTTKKEIYAGTQSGLYLLNSESEKWQNIDLPGHEKRIQGLAQKGDSVYVMTRSSIFVSEDSTKPDFSLKEIPPPPGDQGKATLFRTLWLIHSGKIYGFAGKLLADIMALIIIYLIISGMIYYFTPGLLKQFKKRVIRSRLKKSNRFFIKWHNRLGKVSVLFLIILALTGIFLRPPFLIPIAGLKVPVIKHSLLDNPNPWYDKLRDIIWDEEKELFIYSTSEGFYYSHDNQESQMIPFLVQPPVSVMGVNVFSINAPGEYLVGSFTGIYRWKPDEGTVKDHISGLPVENIDGLRSPFGSSAVAGYLDFEGQAVLFDYIEGATIINGGSDFPDMPDIIRNKSPISLWNLALEIHTGRIFAPLIGDFYILVVPLSGIGLLIILITGLVIWLRKSKAASSATFKPVR